MENVVYSSNYLQILRTFLWDRKYSNAIMLENATLCVHGLLHIVLRHLLSSQFAVPIIIFLFLIIRPPFLHPWCHIPYHFHFFLVPARPPLRETPPGNPVAGREEWV